MAGVADVTVSDPRAEGDVTRFTVRVGGRSYDVGVTGDDVERLAPGVDASELVRESFAFLLERESPASILSRFDLPVIARYFPDYPAEIRRRMAR